MLSSKYWNNKTSGIKLVYRYSAIKMMRSPINLMKSGTWIHILLNVSWRKEIMAAVTLWNPAMELRSFIQKQCSIYFSSDWKITTIYFNTLTGIIHGLGFNLLQKTAETHTIHAPFRVTFAFLSCFSRDHSAFFCKLCHPFIHPPRDLSPSHPKS